MLTGLDSLCRQSFAPLRGLRIGLVTHTAAVDSRLRSAVELLAAAREAMVNAAKWSGVDTVSVYAEARDGDVSVFVRDWGKGFDLDAVGPDHHGIRESIKARMARHGGTADIRTSPGEGTEVSLRVAAR